MTPIAQILTGKWNQVKGQLKEKYGELTDEDLIYQEGKEDQLLGKIQEKTGKTRQEIQDFITGLAHKI